MPSLETLHFGQLDYQPETLLEFPNGLPAFEEEKQFLPVQQFPGSSVIFLQSLTQPQLVFITLPVLLVDPAYRSMIAPEDLEALELPADRQPEIGAEVLCLAIVTVPEQGPPTANLMAPLVVNVKTRRALQAIQPGSGYSHQHPLHSVSLEESCS